MARQPSGDESWSQLDTVLAAVEERLGSVRAAAVAAITAARAKPPPPPEPPENRQ